jgi:8-oxo-dGTP diphosphatase
MILLLKRASGERVGMWAVPGGAVDFGERPEEAGGRELYEESGLVPAGPLELIGVYPVRTYGRNTYVISYACHCPEGEVVLSETEHSAWRWIDPFEYHEQFFGEAQLEAARRSDERFGLIMREVRADVGRYLAWRSAGQAPG